MVFEDFNVKLLTIKCLNESTFSVTAEGHPAVKKDWADLKCKHVSEKRNHSEDNDMYKLNFGWQKVALLTMEQPWFVKMKKTFDEKYEQLKATYSKDAAESIREYSENKFHAVQEFMTENVLREGLQQNIQKPVNKENRLQSDIIQRIHE